ncbi:Uncharacterised protein [[Clostridium] sordellii]|uniref:DUF4181 domain-containing protein n=1 Tax=Paraclostridium sordellii TaxID=1505 RepID=A0ABM9RQ88_PARSO|nr:hypothetical protein ATCC9714_21041 [[Clostridium] sordellii] [Paeniclostridium sordellii]CEN69758.1 Uncharacterised protein [[Clostridium] sordellii] [Paeniclostridium sordellii]CEN73026.1 Uncharacterised protein [[Clostridium] sordellii] [Paeniclostridium sordellii]CEO25565.1 Uncharacterised protein [[Clostridium] sordellii] [Paeniclostridium sordellii]CEP75381.1 Uncharacterised protein [[Clostridium] sordellii] [Paeniclostridium sordellii]
MKFIFCILFPFFLFFLFCWVDNFFKKYFGINNYELFIIENSKSSKYCSIIAIIFLWLSAFFIKNKLILLLCSIFSVLEIILKINLCKKHDVSVNIKKFLISEWIIYIYFILIMLYLISNL